MNYLDYSVLNYIRFLIAKHKLLPGQCWVLQFWVCTSVSLPEQSLPPCAGDGLLQVRVLDLDCVPPPQVTGHGVQAVNAL